MIICAQASEIKMNTYSSFYDSTAPLFQQLSGVEQNCIFDRFHNDKFAWTVHHFKTPYFVLEEQRDRSVIGMVTASFSSSRWKFILYCSMSLTLSAIKNESI